MSALGFKATVDPLTYMLCHLHTMESSDSLIVQHLLTSWQPACQLSCSDPHTCEQALVGLESRIYSTAASQRETRQRLYQLSYAGSAINFILSKIYS